MSALGSSHPLVGRSVPDFELANGRKIGELLRAGKGLFLDFDAGASLKALADLWGDRIAYVGRDAKDRLGLSALLIHSDGFVAWASEIAPTSTKSLRRRRDDLANQKVRESA